MAPLIIDLEICLVSSLEPMAVFESVDSLPGLWNNLHSWPFRAGDHGVSAFRDSYSNHPRRDVRDIAHFHANDEIVVAVVIAGVRGVNGVDVGIDFVGNLTGDFFPKEPHPLPGD